jgi:hypothetical protein
MSIPDVTGFTLGEAVSMLKAAGITDTTVKLTVAPRNKDKDYNSKSRIVRQLTADNGITEELVVCNLE